MLATTLILSLLVSAPNDCYLVTNHAIERIPCDFSAARTDALRYGGAPRTPKPEAASPQGGAVPAPEPAAAAPPRQDLRNLSPDALREVYDAEKRRLDEARAAAGAPPKTFSRQRRRAGEQE